MKKVFLLFLGIVSANDVSALPIETDYSVDLNNSYGYANYSGKAPDKQNNLNSSLNMYGSITYIHNDSYQTSLIGYFMVDSAKEIENYNQGIWGEEIYTLFESPFGEFNFGQNYNVAYEFSVGAPVVGGFSSDNSDLANYFKFANWYKKNSKMSYKTLNSTYLNTDGVSPKMSYITPSFKGIEMGISYIPKTYSQSGLVSKHAEYKNEEAYVLGMYGNWDISGYELETSLGFADYQENDKEYSVGLSIYHKGWTFGGSYRQTDVDKSDYALNTNDTYREGYAYNLGVSYEIGPFSSGVQYFNSQSENTKNYDKIISFSNSYQYNKYTNFSFTTAHIKSKDDGESKTNEGYAFIFGLELSL